MTTNEQDLFGKVQDRLYILQWSFDNGNWKDEKKQEYFTWEDRSEWIKRYMHLKDLWYVSDIKMFVAEPKEVDMARIISQI